MRSRWMPVFAVVSLLATVSSAQAQSKAKVIAATGFVPRTTTFTFFQGPDTQRYLVAGSEGATDRVFDASLDLPEGAQITGLEIEGCNSAGVEAIHAYVIVADGTGVLTILPTNEGVLIDAGAGCVRQSTFFNGPTYDPRENTYLARVWLPEGDINHRFRSVRVYYDLTVGPAFGPTFNDVPVSDPAYQFIEALARSGITAGCGSGNYCPDNPVTRRQMAVFLAKGLGLGWPVN